MRDMCIVILECLRMVQCKRFNVSTLFPTHCKVSFPISNVTTIAKQFFSYIRLVCTTLCYNSLYSSKLQFKIKVATHCTSSKLQFKIKVATHWQVQSYNLRSKLQLIAQVSKLQFKIKVAIHRTSFKVTI